MIYQEEVRTGRKGRGNWLFLPHKTVPTVTRRSELLEVAHRVVGSDTDVSVDHFGTCRIVREHASFSKGKFPPIPPHFEKSKRFSLSPTWRTNSTSHSDPPQSVFMKMF